MLLVCVGGGAFAQDDVQLVIPESVTGAPGTRVQMNVKIVPDVPTSGRFLLRIVGLDINVRLANGYRVSDKAWAVPVAKEQDLQIVFSDNAVGDLEVEVVLVTIDDVVAARANTTLHIKRAGANQRTASVGAITVPSPAEASRRRSGGRELARRTPDTVVPGRQGSLAREAPAQVRPRQPPLTPEKRNMASRLLRRGNTLWSQGQIVQARLFYRRAAELGLAEGAFALGMSFDPRDLRGQSVVGIVPDVKAARRWYTLAAELGSEAAIERLSFLPRQ